MRTFASAFAFVAFTLVGCISTEKTTGPIMARPLGGTLDGESWTAQSARCKIETLHGKDRCEVEIFAVPVACGEPVQMPHVRATVPWHAGAGDEVTTAGGAELEVTLMTDGFAGVDSARSEVLEAPTTAGQVGKLRLRVRGAATDIEGEVAVAICE